MTAREYGFFDRVLMGLDRGLRSMAGGHTSEGTNRDTPAANIEETAMKTEERALSMALMRVNHAGEIAAQGLYHGQAWVARDSKVKNELQQAAVEENDHLCWCKQRVEELNGDISLFTPLWYLGSVGIGAIAGLSGDRWSLGFIVETEYQVIRHLDGHLQRLPDNDKKSRAILQQMKADEAQHATQALESGGAPLPEPVKKMMALTSKVMTKISFKV